MENLIYLKRRSAVILSEGTGTVSISTIATALKNINDLGYTFNKELFDQIQTLDEKQFNSFYTELVGNLKTMLGAHVVHNMMYPNFPKQVMEISDSEMFVNNLVHWFTICAEKAFDVEIPGQGLPQYDVEVREAMTEKMKALKEIKLGNEKDFAKIFSNLIGSKTSISDSDKEDVKWAINNFKDINDIMPEDIHMKENLAFLTAYLMETDKPVVILTSRYFKTATDVLRLATALSGGDVSLAANTKFRSFKRSERRMLLGLLERVKSNITEDMLRHKNKWIKLGHGLHVSEYQQFIKVNQAFNILRNSIKYETFNTKVEEAIKANNIDVAVTLLKTRPGDFARRLDTLIRKSTNQASVVQAFESVAGEVSTPVLLQLTSFYKYRNEDRKFRTFFPKGSVAHAHAIENTLAEISEEIIDNILEVCEAALVSKFSELDELGKVYIDKELVNFNIPFSQRSANDSLKTITRGSKFAFDEADQDKNIIRLFTYWKEGVNKNGTGSSEYVDIDLSGSILDENLKHIATINFGNRRDDVFGLYHSGDIRSAPNGASEFIDIDIAKCIAKGGRYLVPSNYSYTSVPYCDLTECFSGWMLRDDAQSGEIYEPRTVANKYDIAGDTTYNVPAIIDLVNREVIWCDLSLQNDPRSGFGRSNTVNGNLKGIEAIVNAMLNIRKTSVYELLTLHAKARGTIVENIEDAEVVYSTEKGTQFELDKLMAEFL